MKGRLAALIYCTLLKKDGVIRVSPSRSSALSEGIALVLFTTLVSVNCRAIELTAAHSFE